MKRAFLAAVAAIAMLFGLAVVAAPANAGYCSYIGSVQFCGSVKAASTTKRSVLVTNAWGYFSSPNTKLLYAGQLSSNYSGFKDTDGFYVPTGCRARNTWDASWPVAYPGWTKINDTQDVSIEIYGC